MEDFSITTRLTTREFAKTTLIGVYQNPIFILAMILGLYYSVTLVLDYFKIASFYTDTPYFEIVCGLLLLLMPILILLLSVRQFVSNPVYKNEITYVFTDVEFTMHGLTYKCAFQWAHILKHKEIGNFLILYHTKRSGNFIDKTKLTADQLEFIKTKVPVG
jgi:hypothetical protein